MTWVRHMLPVRFDLRQLCYFFWFWRIFDNLLKNNNLNDVTFVSQFKFEGMEDERERKGAAVA